MMTILTKGREQRGRGASRGVLAQRLVCESCGRKCQRRHAMIAKGSGIGLSVCGWCINPLFHAGWKRFTLNNDSGNKP